MRECFFIQPRRRFRRCFMLLPLMFQLEAIETLRNGLRRSAQQSIQSTVLRL
jgi:hypothetical protein